MKSRFFKLIISLLILSSCSKNEKLFFIENRNDFLFMAESTNVKNLNVFIKNQYINKNKLSNPKSIFKEFDNIKSTSFYKAIIVLENDTTKNYRDYEFSVITINNKNELIDFLNIAKLDDSLSYECTGKIDEYLTITKECVDSLELKEIDSMGNIREYSSW